MSLYRKLKNTYYVPGTDSRPLADVFRRLTSRSVPSFPRDIQIQTRTGCNAACVFCPYEASYRVVPKGKMSDELFARLVAEIGQHNVTRRVSPYLMNEPFLDQDIIEKSRRIRAGVRSAKVVLTTNASVLGEARVDEIMRDNPFHAIYVSMQGIEKDPYEEAMRGRLVFETTKANVDYLVAQRNAHAPGLKIVVTMVKTTRIDAEKAVDYWRAQGVESKYTALENRGGNIEAFGDLAPGERRIYRDCTRLFKHAYILFNGDMVLCCTDYYKTMVLGNVAESSIRAVWNSPRSVEIRRNFLRGDLRDNPLCANCEIADGTVD